MTVQDTRRPDGLRQPGGGAAARAARRPRRADRRARRRSPTGSRSAIPTGGRSRVEELPGYRVLEGETPHAAAHPEHLQGDGRAALVPDQGDAARGRDRRAARGQRDRGRHRGARGRAARALPRRGRPGARVLARLRGARSSASRSSRCRSSPTGARSSCPTSAAACSRSRSRTSTRARVEEARELRERFPPDPDAALGTAAVMRNGEPQLYAEIPDELLASAARDDEQLAAVRSLGLRSAMIVPMASGGRTLGAISFVFADSGRRYVERDLAFAQELATRAATAIENARLYTERSDVAQTLQASLLPDELPELPGWRLRRRLPARPARRRGRRRLLRRVPRRRRAPGRARRRHGQGRAGGRPDVARALHGARRRRVRRAARRPCSPRSTARCASGRGSRP